jgi:hypothetical protein
MSGCSTMRRTLRLKASPNVIAAMTRELPSASTARIARGPNASLVEPFKTWKKAEEPDGRHPRREPAHGRREKERGQNQKECGQLNETRDAQKESVAEDLRGQSLECE